MCAPSQPWVALKFSIAHLLPVAYTALRVRSAGPSRLRGMEARASIIPQFGQMSVVLSARERTGGSVYLLPQIGHTRPACSLLLTAASFRLLWSAVRPQGVETQFPAVDVYRPNNLGKGSVAGDTGSDALPFYLRTLE